MPPPWHFGAPNISSPQLSSHRPERTARTDGLVSSASHPTQPAQITPVPVTVTPTPSSRGSPLVEPATGRAAPGSHRRSRALFSIRCRAASRPRPSTAGVRERSRRPRQSDARRRQSARSQRARTSSSTTRRRQDRQQVVRILRGRRRLHHRVAGARERDREGNHARRRVR